MTVTTDTGCSCTCILLPLLVNIIIVIMSSSPVVVLSHPAPPVITRRWFNPCHGDDLFHLPPTFTTSTTTPTTTTSGSSTVISGLYWTTSGLRKTTSGSSEVALDVAALADSFHAISTKATRLKRHVRELKDLYVRSHLHNLCWFIWKLTALNVICILCLSLLIIFSLLLIDNTCQVCSLAYELTVTWRWLTFVQMTQSELSHMAGAV